MSLSDILTLIGIAVIMVSLTYMLALAYITDVLYAFFKSWPWLAADLLLAAAPWLMEIMTN